MEEKMGQHGIKILVPIFDFSLLVMHDAPPSAIHNYADEFMGVTITGVPDDTVAFSYCNQKKGIIHISAEAHNLKSISHQGVVLATEVLKSIDINDQHPMLMAALSSYLADNLDRLCHEIKDQNSQDQQDDS